MESEKRLRRLFGRPCLDGRRREDEASENGIAEADDKTVRRYADCVGLTGRAAARRRRIAKDCYQHSGW